MFHSFWVGHYSEQTPDQEEGALFLQLPASATDLHFFSLQEFILQQVNDTSQSFAGMTWRSISQEALWNLTNHNKFFYFII